MDVATGTRWGTPPPSPRAIPGVVDVWRVDLDAAPDALADLLCAQERSRAARIVHERNRTLWTRSRGVLRALLGLYLERDPRELRFELGPHGKPALAGGAEQEPDLRFNLSHSHELMLVAVSAGLEVGVDIECADERHTPESLRTWTMHEATVKCLGTGLTSMPIEDEAPVAGLWTAELDVGPRATAAVAVQGVEVCELRRWDTAPTLTP